MHIHEFGNKENPVILLLSGTMCYWKGNFGGVIEELAKDFLVAAVAYTGFDEEDVIARSVRTRNSATEIEFYEYNAGRNDIA